MFTKSILSSLILLIFAQPLFASNPIITWRRNADPSPKVYNGRVFLYCSRDQENASNYNSMDNYFVYSSTDLEHWVDHGEVLNSSQLINHWGGVARMWAPDCAYKNGIYYFYFPATNAGGTGIGVSRVPQGPFKDTLGKPVMSGGIDPMCFIDDDGAAYLYLGGATCTVAKLKPDMISLAETPRTVDYGNTITLEGPYIHKRNGIYYFSGSHGNGYYAMGNSPYGPFTWKGMMAVKPPGAQDHNAIIEYKGTWYYFHHIGNYTDANGIAGNSHRRNCAIERIYYNADNTIKPIVYTSEGVSIPYSSTPSTPANLKLSVAKTKGLRLDWSESTDTAALISSYIIYRAGVKIGTKLFTDSTMFIDSTQNANSTASYQVSAVNGAFKEGAKSSPVGLATGMLSESTKHAQPIVTTGKVCFGNLTDLGCLANKGDRVEIYSLQGKKIMSGLLDGNKAALQNEKLKTGNAVYYVKFTHDLAHR